MLTGEYTRRSARPRLTSEPELLRVEPREPVVPVFTWLDVPRVGVVRARRGMGIARWKVIAP